MVLSQAQSRVGRILLSLSAVRRVLAPRVAKTAQREQTLLFLLGRCFSVNGALFSWGRGSHGRLGHGTTDDVDEPKRKLFFPSSLFQFDIIFSSYGIRLA